MNLKLLSEPAVALAAGVVLTLIVERTLGPGLDRLIFAIKQKRSQGTDPAPISGIWRASFLYRSSESSETLVDEYLMVLRRGIGGIRGFSIENTQRSSLTLSLQAEGEVLTGTWRERTPGSARGYHGVCQLLLRPTGDLMEGKWVGFTRTREVGHGPWEYQRLTVKTGWITRRRYKNARGLRWREEADPSLIAELETPGTLTRFPPLSLGG